MDAMTTTLLTPLDSGRAVDGLPGRIQLFPSGEFAARDGRPATLKDCKIAAWRLTPEDARALVARWRERRTPVVVDYEHQTHNSAQNGQPAPAAGWITDLSTETDGLYAAVEWTPRAREYIRAGEYRFISPTFVFDRKSGAVLDLLSAALTNYPALDGMQPAQAKRAPAGTGEGDAMNEIMLAHLRTVLGLAADADEAACAAALAEAAKGGSIAAQLKTRDDALAALRNAAPDPALYAPVALLKAERERSAALSTELEKLKTEQEAHGLEGEIEAALRDGRLARSGEAWARALAKSNPDILRDYLRSAAPIAALSGRQSDRANPADKPGATSLTDEDRYAIRHLGISTEDYIAAKSKETD